MEKRTIIQNKTKKKTIDWQEVKEKLTHINQFFQGLNDPEHLHAVYRNRAETLAKRRDKVVLSQEKSPVLIFSLEKEHFAVAIRHLQEIIPLSEYTFVPKTHSSILGVMNLRGEIRCLLDLAQLLDRQRKSQEPPASSPGYVLMLKVYRFGLKVDQIDKILTIENKEDREPFPSSHLANRYIKTILPGNILLLDVDQILSHPVFHSTNS